MNQLFNVKTLLGITNYSQKYSLMPKNGLLPEVKIVILVIVRWNDKGGLISEGIFTFSKDCANQYP